MRSIYDFGEHELEIYNRVMSRFLTGKAGPHGGCWEISGYAHAAGYPLMHVTGIKTRKVSRLMCTMFHGECISPNIFTLHSCDNPKCVNPKHLRWGTYTDNAQDILLRGRNPRLAKTHCPEGHPYTEDNIYQTKVARVCKTCVSVWGKEYYARNRLRVLQAGKIREQKNREKINARRKAKRERDKFKS